MSFLTRIQLDGREAANERLADGYAWHQALWCAFPGRDGAARDFLFRVDEEEDVVSVARLTDVENGENGNGVDEESAPAPAT